MADEFLQTGNIYGKQSHKKAIYFIASMLEILRTSFVEL